MWDGNKRDQDGRFEGGSEKESNEKETLEMGPVWAQQETASRETPRNPQ